MKVLPVVHVTSLAQGVEQSSVAIDLGADGVFLIGHSTGTDEVLATFAAVVSSLPSAWVGVNLLGCGSGFNALQTLRAAAESTAIPRLPDGLWADDARPDLDDMMTLRSTDPPARAVTYYGGVSFKYTSAYSDDPEGAAESARSLSPCVDVVTTSGPGTGQPAPVPKLAAMKQAIGSQRLGLASGASIDNIADYLGVVDDVLVASSVETSPYSGVFDVPTLRVFIELAHRAD